MSSAMLHTNDDFLNAIRAEPHERTLRLVYADWLDEHNDPRGELIRAEEEMRQVPVFADRFWELKPRRNELRTMAGSEWCALMKYGTECEPVFWHGIPDGWRERWRLIREFTERWHCVPMPDVGGRQSEIAEVEARLRRRLPPSVREWISFGRDASGGIDNSFMFGGVFEVEATPNASAISVVDLHQGHRWGIRQIDGCVPDPPVYFFEWPYGLNVGVPDRLLAQSVTDAIFHMLMTYPARVSQCRFYRPQGVDLLADLERHFPRPTMWSTTRIFETNNAIVTHKELGGEQEAHVSLRVASQASRESLPAFLRKFILDPNNSVPF
ncbi:hypothetical protein VT84_04010 [Gemmata sp. SH-PL17]|uniref:TIGR02996 domain-containing protein n=1 Tax=Gemmata sp. SH-PL17 TaxID=1630693 RepID=UPI00078DD8B3|nr:TIGR02996 domain-containing protein [Gemmata sp. SH-PL17]AMV23550.1 hypothetical protein VT84_04010 [Gemmata sp. SH-PL17]